MPRVLIVDDERFVRDHLTTILTAQGLDVVGEATDGDEVIEAIARHRPDVVLLDLTMRRVSGLDVLPRIVALPAAPRVVVLTSLSSDQPVMVALRAGAMGYLTKDEEPSVMGSQIRTAAAGRHALGGHAATALVQRQAEGDRDQEAARELLGELTAREREVAALAGQYTNQQIGRRLTLSENTVKYHLGNAMSKLGIDSRGQLAVLADRAGLRPPEAR